MARKGKAQRRVKDWEQQFRRDAGGVDAGQRETLLPQRVKIPASREETPTGQSDQPPVQGMVVGIYPAGACVRIDGRDRVCQIAGTFRPPPNASALAVGDVVTVALSTEQHLSGGGDMQRADGAILGRELRQTVLARPQPISGKHRGRYDENAFEKVIAANMELLLIVASVQQPRVRPMLIDRFCITAERGGLKPVVVFNKIDLGAPDEEMLAQLGEGDIAVFLTSARTGEGVEPLREALAGKKSVLAGPSGAGKSSLLNVLIPGTGAATQPVRAKDDRGRHTTAAATIHELPGGGLIVDTPGVRELALEMDANELPWYFPEMAAVAGDCKFNDCTHTHEPDCAVRSAAEEGRISLRRYHSYLRILDAIQE